MRADSITVLLPCRDQCQEYLTQSVGSVRAQSSPRWKLLACLDEDSPLWIRDYLVAPQDERISFCLSRGGGLGGALNVGMARATTEFVCILLSDDRLTGDAIAILARSIQAFPDIDYFHSARRILDANGKPRSKVLASRSEFPMDYFWCHGSPVKHLMCWRRSFALAMGGMDESLSAHGCDDYDFPWCMAEAGARFRAIPECLYEYRVHRRHARLTTDVPLARQEGVLRAMFAKHQVAPALTEDYLRRAREGYLVRETVETFEEPLGYRLAGARCYLAGEGELREMHLRGWMKRHLFPHRIHYLPKPGPDGHKLALRHHGRVAPGNLMQILLYAEESGLPESLFFDEELNWHGQHFQQPGLVAYADLLIEGKRVYVHVYCSDLVQRISRQRQHKTRVEKRLDGWTRMLVHAVAHYARQHNLREIYSVHSEAVLRHTDARRATGPELFQRIYDRTLQAEFPVAREGIWWRCPLSAITRRVVPLTPTRLWRQRERTICLCHDVEQGWGHRGLDDALSEQADKSGHEALLAMLAIEKECQVRATYNVVGLLLAQLRQPIEKDGHCLAFHSYDHRVAPRTVWNRLRRWKRRWFPPRLPEDGQLGRCREVDNRLKGYRPPQSRLAVGERELSYYNFEWLASSASSLGHTLPEMREGVVRIPIHADDFALYRGAIQYPEWEASLLQRIERSTFFTFSLHDCYAHLWLPHYRELLRKVAALGDLRTLDQVAAEVALAHGR